MILPRLALSFALAATPMSFGHNGNGGKLNGYRCIADTVDFITWREETHHGKVLFIDGHRELVASLRALGIRAFATVPRWAASDAGRANVIGVDRHLPFRENAFALAWYVQENFLHLPLYWQLREVAQVVQPQGFLVFAESEFPHWAAWLKTKEWFRLPFSWNGYGVWQKPGRRIQESA